MGDRQLGGLLVLALVSVGFGALSPALAEIQAEFGLLALAGLLAPTGGREARG